MLQSTNSSKCESKIAEEQKSGVILTSTEPNIFWMLFLIKNQKGGNLDFTSRVIGACFFEKGLKVCQTKDFHFKQIFCKSKKIWATFQILFISVKPQKNYFLK